MKKQKTIGTASKMLLAWGLPALAGVSLTGVARADDAAPAPLTVAQAARPPARVRASHRRRRRTPL